MPVPDPEILLRARPHISIADHVPGRIRLKFKPSILRDVPEIGSASGSRSLADWDFIEEVKVSALTFSLLVQYDAARLQPGHWERLVEGSEEDAKAVVDHLRGLTI